MWGPILKRLVRMETRYPVHGSQRSLPVAELAHETSSSGLSREEDSPPQMPPTEVSCFGSSSERRISAGLDSLLMVNVNPSFSYHALHYLLKVYGTALRIRLVYDKDLPYNRCYVTFLSCDEARLAFEHVASLPALALKLNFSNHVILDYIRNLENSVPEVRQISPPRWFVVYYRNRRGNFIHASRYLAKEIGTIPEGNLKKYGKRVLELKISRRQGCCNISHALLTTCLRP
ncbi:hypothetical protein E2C01_057571 [Portunus trituberculatus]|uniref:RRM domain-containing protein n=1 Tax=Portunus trituberculatus TaxID=210409 RepID=A0A5B7GXB3_PORTR|nr:hypothetical protein [Portunus trituberculatus]